VNGFQVAFCVLLGITLAAAGEFGRGGATSSEEERRAA
jgi:hypothetical protein